MSTLRDPRAVLRYWLAMIRREEALAAAVRAAPRATDRPPPNLADLGRGQPYFKLTEAEHLPFIVRQAPRVSLPVTEDRAAFFEHWLQEEWRRRRWSRDSEEPPMVVGFPVLHDAAHGELRTILRFTVPAPTWTDTEGKAWHAPDARTKPKGPPPATLVLAEALDDEAPPFGLDEVALSRLLSVPEEHVAAVSRAIGDEQTLGAREAIGWVLALLRTPVGDPPPESPADVDDQPLEALVTAAAGRIESRRLRAFPIGLCWDAGSSRATHYLQQDLRALAVDEARWRPSSAFGQWIDGRLRTPGRKAQLGSRPGRPLTDGQRRAAQAFLGSKVTAVQGPPGTGKTELILALCAHTTIERALDGRGPMLLVTSTNNRAVDNVVDPLSSELEEHRLPVALRIGSRPVTKEVTVATLQRTLRWLQHPPARDVASDEAARQRVKAAQEALEHANAQLRSGDDANRRVEVARNRLNALNKAREKALAAGLDARQIRARGDALAEARTAFEAVYQKLVKAIGKMQRARGVSIEAKIRAARRLVTGKQPQALVEALTAVGLTWAVPDVPEASDSLESWVEFLDGVAEATDELENELDDLRDEQRLVKDTPTDEEIEEAERTLAAAKAAVETPQDPEEVLAALVRDHEEGLFEDALQVREAWATEHAERLAKAVKRVATVLAETPSLKSARRNAHRAVNDVLDLFPVLGCTLLSMGNGFELDANCIARVVIDESGQCHPAHAVSAIYRAERALVIGDVHQLEPVIGLDEAEETRVLRRLRTVDTAQIQGCRVVREAHPSVQRMTEAASQERRVLTDHFRCQAPIALLSDRLANYGLEVRTPEATLAHRIPALAAGPLIGLDVRGEQISEMGSWANHAEVAAAVALCQRLRAEGMPLGDVALLTPYRAQVSALRRALRRAGLPVEDGELAPQGPQMNLLESPTRQPLTLGTVHRFQGGERDVVIYCSVVSRVRSLAFTNDRVNLINVAVSRARKHLIVIGDRDLLARGDVTRHLVDAIPATAWDAR